MSQQDLGIRDKIALGGEVGVVDPPGKAFDAAFRLGAIRDVGGHLGELCALTPHEPTDERRERGQVPGDHACGLARIALSSGLPYGTIPAEVVTHRLLLLEGSPFPGSIRRGQPLKPPFYHTLKNCPGVKGQNTVVGSMTILLAVRGNIATRSMSGPPFALQLHRTTVWCRATGNDNPDIITDI